MILKSLEMQNRDNWTVIGLIIPSFQEKKGPKGGIVKGKYFIHSSSYLGDNKTECYLPSARSGKNHEI